MDFNLSLGEIYLLLEDFAEDKNGNLKGNCNFIDAIQFSFGLFVDFYQIA
jgi:hypothetical protein